MSCCKKFEKAKYIQFGVAREDWDVDPPKYEPGWVVLGCCFNCYVLELIKYCPFCGTELPSLQEYLRKKSKEVKNENIRTGNASS
jgi:hypothetical protein